MFFRYIFPFKVARATRIWGPKSQRCHNCTTVSITPLCMSQRCQWLRCACHSGVNDTAVPSAERIIFLHKKTVVFRIIRENFRQSWLHSGVNDSAVHVTAVSMTPLCNQLCKFTPQIRSHFQKGFNPCIRGLGGSSLIKNNRGRKSRVRVPLIHFYKYHRFHAEFSTIWGSAVIS
jgi:hypothetical protein